MAFKGPFAVQWRDVRSMQLRGRVEWYLYASLDANERIDLYGNWYTAKYDPDGS